MRTIGVVTTSRADYGIYRPVMRAIDNDPALELAVLVTGMHLSAQHGTTADDITADGFSVRERIATLSDGDAADDVTAAIGRSIGKFGDLFCRWRPDILVVLGDRFDMYGAAVAALPFAIPVAHIHGGEVTEGAIDDALRHSMTKLAHLHFVSTETHARRVRQLGEEDWRITVSGAPGLDNIATTEPVAAASLCETFGFDLTTRPLLVTFHPVTLETGDTDEQITAFLDGIGMSGLPVIFTAPNADTGGLHIRHAIDAFVAERSNAWMVENLGTRNYFALMHQAAVMVGNSSSGIIEAASFGLPVVNVGNRQKGRDRARNVIDVPCRARAIADAIDIASGEEFRASLDGLVNPYGDGHAASRISDVLRDTEINQQLVQKHFIDRVVRPGT